ncbi:hypothetical protein RDWZM_000222 [Blomia tropicalis]|uniref:Mannosyl-oligosaccharide glucosidase n=1 Tax=Blomia tropicalis TaxID=40697 RepID=A0A9Q0M9P9_BLOTA|nr:hypothetical protein RDWZM_000222 [Blomia tropicalis]
MEIKFRRRKLNKPPPGPDRSILAKQAKIANKKILIIEIIFLLISSIVLIKLYLKVVPDETFLAFNGSDTFPNDLPLGNQYWSSLVSGHYFGLRSASPKSPIVSMMWFRNQIENNVLPIRHWCQHEDGLKRFIWNYNDLNFGHQTIYDRNLHINTSFIKFNQNIIRAQIKIIDTENLNQLNSIILYSAIESEDDLIYSIDPDSNDLITLKVFSSSAGNYTLYFKITDGELIAKSHLHTNSTLDQLKESVMNNLFIFKGHPNIDSIFMISDRDRSFLDERNNFIAYQIVFQKFLTIDMEMIFNDFEAAELNLINYEQELLERCKSFDEKFENIFSMENKGFSNEMITFSRSIMSNMIGGISYFYGTSLVKSPHSKLPKPYGPIQLLTAVPSRSFFPRGFLWDEAFHQLLISLWDPNLSKTIIKSWFDIINNDGWIPREVILGDEAKARVPREFLVQHSTNGNPPVFFLTLESLIDNDQADDEWLGNIYPRLKSWYNWFNTTQSGQIPTTFRWRGRNYTSIFELNPKTLASGFDDYPRATHPSDDEIHLDLRCWMALASRVMNKIVTKLRIKDDSYKEFYAKLSDNQLLEQLHWSTEHNMFCDKGHNSDSVELVTEIVADIYELTLRQVNHPPVYGCVPNFGYANLFPLAMNLLEPDNPKLEIILNNIEDPNQLWSPFGLRSLSRSNFYYDQYNTRTDGPYWRGAIWINMNYLTLKGLKHYSTIPGPYQEHSKLVYEKLRQNLIQNMFKQFVESGYVWEQYSDETGTGKGTHPFTGWSALIIRIMAEQY